MLLLTQIDVQVQDIADTRVRAEISEVARRVLSHLVGAWEVRVAAVPEARGSWMLRVRVASQQHLSQFAAPYDEVPAFVEQRLRAYVQQQVAMYVASFRAPAASRPIVRAAQARTAAAKPVAAASPVVAANPVAPPTPVVAAKPAATVVSAKPAVAAAPSRTSPSIRLVSSEPEHARTA